MADYLVSSIAILTASFALFGLGLNLQWGYTGLVNFGHVAFMTVGAYTTVLLSKYGIPGVFDDGVPLVLAVLAGMFFASILGGVIGLSTLRLREDYLAIVTIGVSEVVRLIALNEEQITNGSQGVYSYPLPLENFTPNEPIQYLMAAVLLGIAGIGLWRIWQWMIQQIDQSQDAQRFRSPKLGRLGFAAYLGAITLTVGLMWQGLTSHWSFFILSLPLIVLSSGVVFSQFQTPLKVLMLIKWPRMAMFVAVSTVLGLVGLVVYAGCESILNDYNYKTGLMWLLWVTLALVFWRLERLVNSPWGRVLKAVREDEEVVKALGKNVFRYKMQSLILGGAIAGLAGSFFAWNLTFINPDGFIPLVTFQAWIMVVLGGSGNNVGTLLGAAIFWAYDALTRFLLPSLFTFNSDQEGAFRIMIIGLILIVLMMWRPQGILGNKEELTLGR
jgi:neutral amino acid transport system permease protein